MITTVISFGCATNLPADFPKPPAINICLPHLTGKKNEPNRVIDHWICQLTSSDIKRTESANYVVIGVPIEDWNQGQNYRSSVEEYFKSHRCEAK